MALRSDLYLNWDRRDDRNLLLKGEDEVARSAGLGPLQQQGTLLGRTHLRTEMAAPAERRACLSSERGGWR